MTMLGIVFRVQCIFPNMESVAMLNEKYQQNSEKIGKKSSLMMDGYCFRVQCTLLIMENNAFLDENSNKIQRKSEKNRDDAGRALFSGSNVHFQWKHLHF